MSKKRKKRKLGKQAPPPLPLSHFFPFVPSSNSSHFDCASIEPPMTHSPTFAFSNSLTRPFDFFLLLLVDTPCGLKWPTPAVSYFQPRSFASDTNMGNKKTARSMTWYDSSTRTYYLCQALESKYSPTLPKAPFPSPPMPAWLVSHVSVSCHTTSFFFSSVWMLMVSIISIAFLFSPCSFFCFYRAWICTGTEGVRF